MNPSIEIIGNIICAFFISIAAYGALKQKKEILLFGVFFFSTTPIIGELLAYAQDDNLLHLVIVMVFLVQVAITLPINVKYDVDNPAAVALSQKIGLAIVVANLCQGCLILNTELDVPHQFGYLHLVVALIMLYTVVRSNTKKEIH
ncbi:hypothetical protein OAC97_00530 [Flavobacteriaceae bacterium]|nr:hypothetical protein [Flavobacteriaceae bacterium]